MDKLTKRLLGLMQIGGRLEAGGGHIWIYCDERAGEHSLGDKLAESGVLVNNKIYRGIREALDAIDEALKLCGEGSLIEYYNEECHFMGTAGPDMSRIAKTKNGEGGLV